ncbi:MAG: PIN domain-containing protein, partial [Rhodocyclaceae bacterium]|nr:PIN domain-containing protein [Rhodocyclaceae bacterium]
MSAEAARVVLDTNVLVSLWVFTDSRYAPLRHALEAGRWQAITNAACLGEFERVLDYPQFALALAPAGRRAALAAYGALARVVAAPAAAAPLPRCKDPDDQKFL